MVRVLNAEKEALRAVLHDEWESEDDLIKALVNTFFELLENRDLYGVRWGGLAYGPFVSKTQAQSMCRALDDMATAVPMWGTWRLKRAADLANPAVDQHHCPGCMHPKFAHGFSNKQGCIVKSCDCEETYK